MKPNLHTNQKSGHKNVDTNHMKELRGGDVSVDLLLALLKLWILSTSLEKKKIQHKEKLKISHNHMNIIEKAGHKFGTDYTKIEIHTSLASWCSKINLDKTQEHDKLEVPLRKLWLPR